MEYKSNFFKKIFLLSAFCTTSYHLSVRNDCNWIRHLKRHRTGFMAYCNTLLCLLGIKKKYNLLYHDFSLVVKLCISFQSKKKRNWNISAAYIVASQDQQFSFSHCDGCCPGLQNTTIPALPPSQYYIHCIPQHELTVKILNIALW